MIKQIQEKNKEVSFLKMTIEKLDFPNKNKFGFIVPSITHSVAITVTLKLYMPNKKQTAVKGHEILI